MDPITLAIIGGLASGAAGAATTPAIKKLAASYQDLKARLQQAFGSGSDLADAMDRLESDPSSEGRRAVLSEEVAKAGADKNDDLVAAAQAFLEAIKEHPGGEQNIQIATGSNIAQADRGSTATVNVNTGNRDKDR